MYIVIWHVVLYPMARGAIGEWHVVLYPMACGAIGGTCVLCILTIITLQIIYYI